MSESRRIPIPHLERFRERVLAQRNTTAPAPQDPLEWQKDTTMLSGLNLGLHETMAFLYGTGPSLERFEEWILERNAGAISPERAEAINAAVRGETRAPVEPAQQVFTADDLAFFDEHGYVVLHDALPPEEVQVSVDAICAVAGIELDDPSSWYRSGAGRDPYLPVIHHAAVDANRNAPRIRSAFAQLWGRNDLWASVEQCYVNLPEAPGWGFSGQRLHWDVSLAPPIPFGIHGQLYLTDTEANQAALTCVPGFHRKIDAWLAGLPQGVDPRTIDLYRLGAYSIPGSAGDLILWHQAVPHAVSPNRAHAPRVAQSISMRPALWEERMGWK